VSVGFGAENAVKELVVVAGLDLSLDDHITGIAHPYFCGACRSCDSDEGHNSDYQARGDTEGHSSVRVRSSLTGSVLMMTIFPRDYMPDVALSCNAGLPAIFGGNVRRFRQQKQLTREELAFEAEIDLTYVGGIERGTKNPSEAGATVRDSAGNGCGTHTAVVAFSPPVPQAPFVVPVTHVFKVTKYDPTTGIGDQSLTEYSGGT